MNRITYIALTWIAFIAMFTVNVLANYLPINGLNTGQVSALYPNLFVPDGFTFSIWSIIYLWLLVFTGYTTNVLVWLPAIDQRYRRIVDILPYYWLTCMFNALWIVCWHYLQVGLSLLVMLLLLGTLFYIYLRLIKIPAHPRKRDHFLVEVPFIIYFGWISVATLANASALLVHLGWKGEPAGQAFWAILLIAVASALGAFMAQVHNRPAYTLVIIWALWGIFRARYQGVFSAVDLTALIGIIICAGFALLSLFRTTRGLKPTK